MIPGKLSSNRKNEMTGNLFGVNEFSRIKQRCMLCVIAAVFQYSALKCKWHEYWIYINAFFRAEGHQSMHLAQLEMFHIIWRGVKYSKTLAIRKLEIQTCVKHQMKKFCYLIEHELVNMYMFIIFRLRISMMYTFNVTLESMQLDSSL